MRRALVGGCVGTLIKAIVPELAKLDYTEFMQGNRTVSLAQLRSAAAAAVPNPDRYLARVVQGSTPGRPSRRRAAAPVWVPTVALLIRRYLLAA
jgi:hypothetical protein